MTWGTFPTLHSDGRWGWSHLKGSFTQESGLVRLRYLGLEQLELWLTLEQTQGLVESTSCTVKKFEYNYCAYLVKMLVSSKCAYRVAAEIRSNILEILETPTMACWHVSSQIASGASY